MPDVLTAPAAADVERPHVVADPPPPTAVRARHGRRHWMLVASRWLTVVGVVAALFVGFEVSVTALEEQRAQAALLPTFQTQLATTTLDRETATPVEGSPVALLQVPQIGLDQVVVEGTTPADLKSGPGHLRGSPVPGEYGNAVVAGRRTTYGGPFNRLDVLTKGASITVTTGQGVFLYKVTSVSRVSPGQPDPVVGTNDSRLTLITSDPAYLASGRLVVTAALQGKPIAVSRRAPVLVGAADLGLAGDALGLGLGIIWGELLAVAVVAMWRLHHRWPPAVVYLVGAPILIALAVLTFSSVDLLLPGTL